VDDADEALLEELPRDRGDGGRAEPELAGDLRPGDRARGADQLEDRGAVEIAGQAGRGRPVGHSLRFKFNCERKSSRVVWIGPAGDPGGEQRVDDLVAVAVALEQCGGREP